RAKLAPEDNALDVGTGTGVVAMHVAPKVRRVVGVDRSLPMLRVARDRVATSGSRNVLMEFGDLLDLPIRPDSIDVAFCSLVLRLVAKPSDAVTNIARTLRPGGRIVVCDTLRTTDKETGINPAHLSAWLKNAKLTNISLDVLGDSETGKYLVGVGHRE
ncbi:MAG TPA: methyltransferase domain-containing protein, partial [Firmicutes bacterium]|nr:methyltransferase domain-containing protein [Bacillota bacterium]